MDRAARPRAVPESDVVLIEAKTVGWAASGRNGGFAPPASRTASAMASSRFPDEMPPACLSGWVSRTSARSARRSRGTASTATSSRPGSWRSGPRGGNSTAWTRRRSPRGALATTSRCSTRRAPAPSLTRRCGPAASSTRRATRWWSRAASPGGCAVPAWTRGYGSTSTRRRRRFPRSRRAPGRRRGRRTARSAPPGSPSPRACLAGRCCAGSARTWSLSGTTC